MKLFKPKSKLTPSGVQSSVSPDEVTLAREAVDALTGNLKSGAEQQKIAAKRMISLNKTITKMEAALVHTARLESDNVRLSSDVRNAEQKLRQKSAWTDEQEKKLFALKKQRDDFSQRFEDAKVELAQRDDLQKSLEEKLAANAREISELQVQNDQDQDVLEAVQVNMQSLQEDTARQAAELSSQRRRLAELQKAEEEATSRLEQKTQDSDATLKELKVLRVEHADLKEKLFAARSELQTASYNVQTQRTLFEDTLKRRDDELAGLKNQVEQFNTQMRIQENTSSHYDDEIAALRQALEFERERNDSNEQRLRVTAGESERRAAAVKETGAEYEALHSKFVQAVEDLDTLRKINMAQKGKLERYASITSTSAGNGMVHNDAKNRAQSEGDAYRPVLKAVT
ncbi:MAG: hypothetical protein ABJG88_04450 [Litorimonas sp.]